MKRLLRRIIETIVAIPSFILREIVPKKRNLVIMQSNSLNRYCESTRYLYEYLQGQDDLDVYWDTTNLKVYEYLKSQGKKVLWHYSFQAFCKYLRVGIVVGTGSLYPDLLKTVGRKTFKYNIFHGSGPKVVIPTFEKFSDTMDEVYKMQKWDCVSTTSLFDRVMKGQLVFKLHANRLVINGYPRCDHLFDQKRVKQMYEEKKMTKEYFPNYQEGEKVLLYAPTHGSLILDRPVPITEYKDFNLSELHAFLEKNKMVLFLSAHPNGTNLMEIDSGRIRFIDTEKDPFFDMNLLLPEVDVLLGDYSTTHTDFAILKRPQIYVITNYDEYFSAIGFIDDFKCHMCGPEARSFKELLELIIKAESFSQDYDPQRKLILEKYYDVSIQNSCERHAKFIRGVANRHG